MIWVENPLFSETSLSCTAPFWYSFFVIFFFSFQRFQIARSFSRWQMPGIFFVHFSGFLPASVKLDGLPFLVEKVGCMILPWIFFCEFFALLFETPLTIWNLRLWQRTRKKWQLTGLWSLHLKWIVNFFRFGMTHFPGRTRWLVNREGKTGELQSFVQTRLRMDKHGRYHVGGGQ